jgi:hypothetical protein
VALELFVGQLVDGDHSPAHSFQYAQRQRLAPAV